MVKVLSCDLKGTVAPRGTVNWALCEVIENRNCFCKQKLNPPAHSSVEYWDRWNGPMKSAVEKRSVVVGGHKTSISLEDAFWDQLKEIAGAKQCTISKLIAEIDEDRLHGNLSSAIRLFVLEHVRIRGRRDRSPAE